MLRRNLYPILFTIAAASANAQTLTDDHDLALIGRYSARCMAMAGADDGRIVAAWALSGANRYGEGDELMVASSTDYGRSWKILWDGTPNSVSHDNQIWSMSMAIAPVTGPTATRDPQVYIAIEKFKVHRGRAQRRHIACVSGPLNRTWSARMSYLKGAHICGQFASQFQRANQNISARPTVDVLPFGRGTGDHLVVIAYHWPDYNNGAIHLNTPFALHQRIKNGRALIDTRVATGSSAPYVTADRDNHLLYLGYVRNGSIEVQEFRASTWRTGANAYATQSFGSKADMPTLAAQEATCTVLCLEGQRDRDGARPLRRYVQVGVLGFRDQGTLHSRALSTAALQLHGGHAFAGAICLTDRSAMQLVGFRGLNNAWHQWTSTIVGDHTAAYNPAVAAVSSRADGAAFGYIQPTGLPYGVVHIDAAN